MSSIRVEALHMLFNPHNSMVKLIILQMRMLGLRKVSILTKLCHRKWWSQGQPSSECLSHNEKGPICISFIVTQILHTLHCSYRIAAPKFWYIRVTWAALKNPQSKAHPKRFYFKDRTQESVFQEIPPGISVASGY